MNQVFSQNNLKQAGDLIFRSGKDFLNDNAPQWAAAISYYGLLSIFPLLLAVTGIAAYFVDQNWAIQQATTLIGKFLPGGFGQIRNIPIPNINNR